MNLAARLVSAADNSGEGYTPPSADDFNLAPIGPSGGTYSFMGQEFYIGLTKPMLQIIVFGALAFAFLYYASRQRAMVPGRLQYVGEQAYGLVRNSLARDIIGSHDFMRFVPYLVTLFFLLLFNNWATSIPGVQFPTFSRFGLVVGLALLTWVIYNAVGVRKHGFLGYLKLQCVPSGLSGPILILLVPLEFMSNLIVRPVTLALRLFANMFAGHLLILLFALGGEYLLLEGDWIVKPAGILAWVMFIAISFLELLIQFLQAYVFTLLTAMYIAGALADEH